MNGKDPLGAAAARSTERAYRDECATAPHETAGMDVRDGGAKLASDSVYTSTHDRMADRQRAEMNEAARARLLNLLAERRGAAVLDVMAALDRSGAFAREAVMALGTISWDELIDGVKRDVCEELEKIRARVR